jgi:LacI family transcriptional regulator
MIPTRRSKRSKNQNVVTLQHVADLAGVHPMTVSNALKGTGRVAHETREKIRRIAQELDYKPNLAARALVTGKTNSIAVVTGPISEHFYAHVLHLLEIELEASDYKMLFLRSRNLQQDLLSTVRSSAVDGVIAIDAVSELQTLVQAKTSIPPCVYAGVLIPDQATSLLVDHIAIDLSGAAYEAVTAMIQSGCKRVAYLVSNSGMGNEDEVRARSYRAAMRDAGQEPELINVRIGVDTSPRHLTRTRLVEYIREHGAPDGLLCQNDEMAIAAYRALMDLGLRTPEDVQIVGCDGLADLEYFEPPLSTIVQPMEAVCAQAWQFLQRRMEDPNLPLQRGTAEATLRVRRSLKAGVGVS